MRLTIALKVMILTISAVIIASLSILFFVLRMMQPPMEDSMQLSMAMSREDVSRTLDALRNAFQYEAETLSLNDAVLNAVVNNDLEYLKKVMPQFIHVTHAEGLGIFDTKGNALIQAGIATTLRNWQSVRLAIQDNRSHTGIIVESDTVYILHSAVPLRQNNRIIGILDLHLRLTSEEFIDRLKIHKNLEATIFHNDVRIMTTIQDRGSRIIGTRLDAPQISDAVLKRGEIFLGDLEIKGEQYKVAYWPLHDIQNNTVGMWFLGITLGEIHSVQKNVTFHALMVSLIIILIFSILGIIGGMRLGKPLSTITNFAKNIAKGNIDSKLYLKTGDEVEILADNLNIMVDNLKQKINEAKTQSELARLETEKAQQSEQEVIEARKTAELARRKGILDAVDILTKVANVIATITQELSSSIATSQDNANTQSMRMADTAISMREMNASVLSVAENASNAVGISAKTRSLAEDGAKIAQDAISCIQQVQEHSDQLQEDMNQLREVSNNISQVMNVINDIADQTNLLALNAAIEAARAGDAGKGFAVVADEVRKLAEKTIASTADVGKAIVTIQASSSRSMQQVEMTVKTIALATDLVNNSGHALEEIANMAEQTAEQVRVIATAAEEQSQTSAFIHRAIQGVSVLSSETVDDMEKAHASVNNLVSQTQILTQQLEDMAQN